MHIIIFNTNTIIFKSDLLPPHLLYKHADQGLAGILVLSSPAFFASLYHSHYPLELKNTPAIM